mgnify:CR=1 FL=1
MKNFCEIKNVVFDLGGVLLEWNPEKIVAQAFDNPSTGNLIMREIFLHPDWLKFDGGELTESQAIRFFAQKTGRSEEDIEKLMNVYRNSLSPFPESIDFFYELKKEKFKLFCASNIHPSIFRKLTKSHQFLKEFDGVLVSGKIGILKPNPAFYKHLIDAYALSPQETVFIDDKPENVDAAVLLGMHGIVFNTVKNCRRRLHELRGIV